MRKVLVVLLITVFAAVGFAAQEKKEEKKAKASAAKQERWTGTIIRQNKDESTMTVRKSGTNIEKTIVYNSSTQWTKLNKPNADMKEFKDGERVIVLGKYDDKGRLVASRIDLRLPR